MKNFIRNIKAKLLPNQLQHIFYATGVYMLLLTLTLSCILIVFHYQEESEFNKISLNSFLSFKSQIEQEYYIQSIIKESTPFSIPSLRFIENSLEAAGFPTRITTTPCTLGDTFRLNIPLQNISTCLVFERISNSVFQNFKILSPLVIVMIVCFLPILLILYRAIVKEAEYQLKKDLLEEFRHNIASPLLTLKNLFNSSENSIQTGLISAKIESMMTYLNEVNLLEKNEKQIFSINQIIIESIEDKKIELRDSSKAINFSHESNSTFDLVEFNKIEFAHILSNLINNSLNAFSGSGSIAFTTWNTKEYIFIQIKDNGCGVPAEFKSKIFEKGFTHGSHNGTGSGLYQAKYKLNENGGQIHLLESESGALFEIKLPLFCSSYCAKDFNEFVILEDDKFLAFSYEDKINYTFGENSFKLCFLESCEELLSCLNQFSTKTFFILDSQIGSDNTAGVTVANILKEKGFHNIVIHSAFSRDFFRSQLCEYKILPKEDGSSLISFISSIHGIKSKEITA